MGDSGIEAGAGIIKGLELILLCPQSFSSALLVLMQGEKTIDGYCMVGRLMAIRSLDSLCVSERLFFWTKWASLLRSEVP